MSLVNVHVVDLGPAHLEFRALSRPLAFQAAFEHVCDYYFGEQFTVEGPFLTEDPELPWGLVLRLKMT